MSHDKTIKEKTFIAHGAAFDSEQAADEAFEALVHLQNEDVTKALTAAIVRKDEKGKLHVHESTYSGKTLALGGLLSGVVLGAIFPPAGVAVIGAMAFDAVVLGAAAGITGHFAGGLSRKGLREVGDHMHNGEAAIIVVAPEEASEKITEALSSASKLVDHKVDPEDVASAVTDLEGAMSGAEAA